MAGILYTARINYYYSNNLLLTVTLLQLRFLVLVNNSLINITEDISCSNYRMYSMQQKYKYCTKANNYYLALLIFLIAFNKAIFE